MDRLEFVQNQLNFLTEDIKDKIKAITEEMADKVTCKFHQYQHRQSPCKAGQGFSLFLGTDRKLTMVLTKKCSYFAVVNKVKIK